MNSSSLNECKVIIFICWSITNHSFPHESRPFDRNTLVSLPEKLWCSSFSWWSLSLSLSLSFLLLRSFLISFQLINNQPYNNQSDHKLYSFSHRLMQIYKCLPQNIVFYFYRRTTYTNDIVCCFGFKKTDCNLNVRH